MKEYPLLVERKLSQGDIEESYRIKESQAKDMPEK
jgi:hypothetical protein